MVTRRLPIDRGYAWVVLLLALISQTLGAMSVGISGIYFVEIRDGLNVSNTAAGWISILVVFTMGLTCKVDYIN